MLGFILNSVYIAASAAFHFTLIPTNDVSPPALHEVVPAEYKALSYIWNDVYPCRFHGVVVPVERDWEETVDNGFVTQVLPPEPAKIYTYALLVNKKSCPGKADEHVFGIGKFDGSFMNRGLPKGIQILFVGPNKDESRNPKWFGQALNAVQAAADTNPVAKNFLEYTSGDAGKTAAASATPLKAD